MLNTDSSWPAEDKQCLTDSSVKTCRKKRVQRFSLPVEVTHKTGTTMMAVSWGTVLSHQLIKQGHWSREKWKLAEHVQQHLWRHRINSLPHLAFSLLTRSDLSHYEWSILLVSAEDVVCWAHSAGHDGGQDFARTSGAEGGAADQEVTEQKLLLHHQQLQWASVCLGHSLPCLLLWHSAGRDGSTEALFVGFLLSTVYIQVLESFAI